MKIRKDEFYDILPYMKRLGQLFLSMFIISGCTFGGGYVIVSLMKKKFVEEYHWLSMEEMLDLVSIAQLSPGAVAVNGAIVVGYRLAGPLGVVVSVLATILPPFLLISLLSIFYDVFISYPILSSLLLGMQAGVAAVIVASCLEMALPFLKERSVYSLCLMVLTFILVLAFQVNIVWILCIGILLGIWGAIR